MEDKRVKLTQTSVADIEPVAGTQLLIWDTELRGFGLRVSAGGAKSYIMQRRIGKATRRITIGRADDIKAVAARRKALAAASQFAEGFDPVAERRRTEARRISLRDAFKDYMAAPKKKGGGRGAPKKAQTVRDIEKQMGRFDDWLDWQVADISGAMVKKRHAEIAETSPAQANGAMRYLRAALNHVNAESDDVEPILKSNPVDRLNRLDQWAPTVAAKGHIPDDRIAEWIAAVQTGLIGLKYDNEVRDVLVFLLLTGARLAEALGSPPDDYPALRWADVDLKKRLVVFRDTKNRTDHELPLGAALVALLTDRKKVAGQVFVFSDTTGHVPTDLRGAYARISKATGIDVTAHDLRRTFATTASRLDISAYKLKRLTNHISGGDVTAGYVQVTTEDLREAMQRIEDYLLSPERRQNDETNVVKLIGLRGIGD